MRLQEPLGQAHSPLGDFAQPEVAGAGERAAPAALAALGGPSPSGAESTADVKRRTGTGEDPSGTPGAGSVACGPQHCRAPGNSWAGCPHPNSARAVGGSHSPAPRPPCCRGNCTVRQSCSASWVFPAELWPASSVRPSRGRPPRRSPSSTGQPRLRR